MIQLLARLFIKNRDDFQNPNVRGKYGSLCGIVGIILNLLLFAGKFIAGILTASVAVTADAFNNLSDAGSSIITLIGFRLAGKKPDSKHPYGHGRFEYLAGLAVSVLILVMGFELAKASVEKIIHPETTEFSVLSVVILAVSVLVKLYMAFYNGSVGKKIRSEALLATKTDSLSDAISTGAVLVVMLLSLVLPWNLDPWCGLAVSLLILKNGLSAIRDTISPLLGTPPEPELIKQIEDIIVGDPAICGIHDLIVHDYGPGRRMVSLHAEVPGDGNIFELHDVIDNLEHRVLTELGCETTIHMDPIDPDNPLVTELRQDLKDEAKKIHENCSVHDLRIVPGTTHTNVVFDLVLPYEATLTEEEAIRKLQDYLSSKGSYFGVIKVDRSYI